MNDWELHIENLFVWEKIGQLKIENSMLCNERGMAIFFE